MTSNSFYKETKGASSILVIIMMVVLLVFGLAVLTTSLSNVRLGERKRTWLADYYQLEGASEVELASIDGLLLQAEASARAYMETDNYIDDYMLDGPLSDDQKALIFGLAYHDFMGDLITTSIEGQEDTAFNLATPDLESVLEGQEIDVSSLTFSLTLPENNYNKHLQLSLDLLPANPGNLTADYQLIQRFSVTRHTQQQEAFDYDDALDFEDPFEEDGLEGNPFGE